MITRTGSNEDWRWLTIIVLFGFLTSLRSASNATYFNRGRDTAEPDSRTSWVVYEIHTREANMTQETEITQDVDRLYECSRSSRAHLMERIVWVVEASQGS